jgi:hypothetical protein
MTRKVFTDDNTDGYTDDELVTLNAAHDILMARNATPDLADDNDVLVQIEKSLCDKLTNVWIKGATADMLVEWVSSAKMRTYG